MTRKSRTKVLKNILRTSYLGNVKNYEHYSSEMTKTMSIIHVEGVTLVLPSRLFMFNKYWRILASS